MLNSSITCHFHGHFLHVWMTYLVRQVVFQPTWGCKPTWATCRWWESAPWRRTGHQWSACHVHNGQSYQHGWFWFGGISIYRKPRNEFSENGSTGFSSKAQCEDNDKPLNLVVARFAQPHYWWLLIEKVIVWPISKKRQFSLLAASSQKKGKSSN